MPTDAYAEARHLMVETQVVSRGMRDPAVLNAMLTVPREAFVIPEYADAAYEDRPLPIGEEQTISQPYIVARMTEALRLSASDRVLEVGTGSGYAAAILSCIVKRTYTVERIEKLATCARQRLQALGYLNVHVQYANGTLGWPEHALYDGIVVAASGPSVPEALKAQLGIGGRLVMPVEVDPSHQQLIRLTRKDDVTYHQEDLGSVAFVPLIGAQGWEAARKGAGREQADNLPSEGRG
ncbi:MAG: protein-L-isoaspartate(D-aspartate) O-methyltransferase [bacterium]|nr:protein-L-isoaspartate(D-aspartate) O-methyltransferase [bacterium]